MNTWKIEIQAQPIRNELTYKEPIRYCICIQKTNQKQEYYVQSGIFKFDKNGKNFQNGGRKKSRFGGKKPICV